MASLSSTSGLQKPPDNASIQALGSATPASSTNPNGSSLAWLSEEQTKLLEQAISQATSAAQAQAEAEAALEEEDEDEDDVEGGSFEDET